jgi:hypothetical protein
MGGGELNQREGERGNKGERQERDLKAGVENTNMTECTQEIGSGKSLYRSFVLDENILH